MFQSLIKTIPGTVSTHLHRCYMKKFVSCCRARRVAEIAVQIFLSTRGDWQSLLFSDKSTGMSYPLAALERMEIISTALNTSG